MTEYLVEDPDGAMIELADGGLLIYDDTSDLGPVETLPASLLCCPCINFCDGQHRCDVTITYDLESEGFIYQGETTIPHAPVHTPAVYVVGEMFILECVDYPGAETPGAFPPSFYNLQSWFVCDFAVDGQEPGPGIRAVGTSVSAGIRMRSDGTFESGLFVISGGGGTHPITGTVTLSGGTLCE